METQSLHQPAEVEVHPNPLSSLLSPSQFMPSLLIFPELSFSSLSPPEFAVTPIPGCPTPSHHHTITTLQLPSAQDSSQHLFGVVSVLSFHHLDQINSCTSPSITSSGKSMPADLTKHTASPSLCLSDTFLGGCGSFKALSVVFHSALLLASALKLEFHGECLMSTKASR